MAGRVGLFFVFGFVLAAAALAPARAEARLVKRLDFESGNLQQWSFKQALPGRIAVVNSPRRQGHYSARFVVKPGDRPVGGTGERAELKAVTAEHAGVRSWWRWSTFFPRNLNPVRGTWNVFTQWHQIGDTCPPPLQFTIDATNRPAHLYMKVRGGHLSSSCKASSERNFRIGTLHRGRWYRFVLQVKWSPYKSRGFVRVWVNGSRKVSRHIATLYEGQGVYVKQGFYRGPSSKTSHIFHDGLQRFRP